MGLLTDWLDSSVCFVHLVSGTEVGIGRVHDVVLAIAGKMYSILASWTAATEMKP